MDIKEIVSRLEEGLNKQGLTYTIPTDNEHPESTTLQLEGDSKSSCFLSLIVCAGKTTVRRVIGKSVINQTYEIEEINEAFFDLLKDHRDTIKDLIKMYKKFITEE
ncbi:MAG TPA: hypothetical protein VHO84_02375 [Syntrophorhabdaceae bacterium]|nr:hypothetical protein [Syntrophorhabdaceae bacterium]